MRIDIEFPIYKMKRVIGMDDGDGCITMYLISLNCMLKNG